MNTGANTMISVVRTTVLLATLGLILASAGALESSASAAADGGAYALVVSPNNKHEDAEASLKQFIKQLFLKQRSSWPSGEESKPFGRKAGSDEQKAFLNAVLSMSEADLAQHWVAEKQKTGATPPREVGSTDMILKLVQKYDGAFGVVKTEEAKAAGDAVRILFTFDG